MKVLIADDSSVVRTLYKRLLEPYGARFVEVSNGVDAVAAFEHAFCVENFDLILMDLRMPEMDGQQAIEQIRMIEQKHIGPLHAIKYTCAIMLTTIEDPVCLIAAFKEGKCNGYILKSEDPSELLNRLKKFNLIS